MEDQIEKELKKLCTCEFEVCQESCKHKKELERLDVAWFLRYKTMDLWSLITPFAIKIAAASTPQEKRKTVESVKKIIKFFPKYWPEGTGDQ